LWEGFAMSSRSKKSPVRFLIAAALWLATLGAAFAQNSHPVIAAVCAMD
jgi:hypothetical protein